MANDYWRADTAEHTRSADYWRDTDRTDGRLAGWCDRQTSSQPGLICPDTGKLTMYATEDLRALLGRFRLAQGFPERELSH
jgi:hypothetical protein